MRKILGPVLIGLAVIAAGCSKEPTPPPQAVAPAGQVAPGQAPAVGAGTPAVQRLGSETAQTGQAAAPAPGAASAPAPGMVPAPARPPVARTYTLEEGTTIRVRSETSLSTKTNKAGDPFRGSLMEPLVVGDKVIAAKGAEVEGIVADSDDGGRVKGVAAISVRLTKVHGTNGRAFDVATTTTGRQAEASKKKDAAKIAIGSGVGAAIGAIAGGGKGAAIGAAAGGGAGTGMVLATHGDPAKIPVEAVLVFKLKDPVVVK